jgi:isoleucyl-tRNA synthetase
VTLLDSEDADAQRIGLQRQLTVNAGGRPRLGKNVQSVIRASKSGDWTQSRPGW